MVNSIDIKKLNLEELLGVVSLYPWFGAARMELGVRMAQMGAWTKEQFSEASLYVCSRKKMYDVMNAGKNVDYRDSDIDNLLKSLLEQAPADQGGSDRRVVVAGGDYFSQQQYREVRHSDDSVFAEFASRGGDYVEKAGMESFEMYTETLARIYLEQDYINEAREIYLKLKERHPEKSEHYKSIIKKLNETLGERTGN